MRQNEIAKVTASKPHVDFDYTGTGYKPRALRFELNRLTPDERRARLKDVRAASQRLRRQSLRQEAKETASAHGDPTTWRQYDRETQYKRKYAERSRLRKVAESSIGPTDPLLASSDMGGLLSFYLHFSLGISIPEDTDQQPDKRRVLIEMLRALYPNHTAFFAVRPIRWSIPISR
jgi:hypothetical protein